LKYQEVFFRFESENKEKKKRLIDEKSPNIYHHESHWKNDDAVAHPTTRWKGHLISLRGEARDAQSALVSSK
jgi:hypothetical protein